MPGASRRRASNVALATNRSTMFADVYYVRGRQDASTKQSDCPANCPAPTADRALGETLDGRWRPRGETLERRWRLGRTTTGYGRGTQTARTPVGRVMKRLVPASS